MKNIINFSDGISLREKYLTKKSLRTVLKSLNQPSGVEVCVSVISEKEMQELNNRTRRANKVTDVLSFPSLNIKAGERIPQDAAAVLGTIYLGDVVICRQQIQRQAKEFCVAYKQEFVRMVLHSLLHLLGYDHIKEADEKQMHAVEYPIYEKLTKIKLS